MNAATEENVFIDTINEEYHTAESSEIVIINNLIQMLTKDLLDIENSSSSNMVMIEEKREDYEARIDGLRERLEIIKMKKSIDEFYKKSIEEFKQYQNVPNNKGLLQCIKTKYPHFKRKSVQERTKIETVVAYAHEIFDSKPFKEIFSRNFGCDIQNNNQCELYEKCKKMYYKYCIDKLCGVYKHAQALKTGFCNKQILNAHSEPNSISVCITKNTLEANEQWLVRLIKELATLLQRQSQHTKTSDIILVISSKKNKELQNVVTHCKDMDIAWGFLKKPDNKFKIVFICSNKTRLLDVLQMTIDFQNLRIGSNVKLRIIHDEAHNPKEGIPPYRDIVENIIFQPNVLCYIPVTGSRGDVACEKNPLWNDANLKCRALDFTSYDKTKSTDNTYSACMDGIPITIEELKLKPGWRDYNVTEVDEATFISVHRDNNENADMRRCLEFCKFMENDCEIEAMNNGLNCLNMNELLECEYYQLGTFNIHIISTPRRKIITRYLATEAITKIYRPIVLAIYGNEGDKYHLLYDNNEEEVSDKMGSGEFNEKLEKLLSYLITKQINIQRPFIIMGNYTPTGESLSYVNYKYGTVRGNIRLISTNAEEDYQEACRSNYMKTMFIKNDPNFVSPEKFLVGPAKYIANALWYEKENDNLIDNLSKNTNENENLVLPIDTYHPPIDDAGGIMGVPVRFDLDRTHPKIQALESILMKVKRTREDKCTFMQTLKECCADDESGCSFSDPSGKFNFDYTLVDFRCYKKKDTPPVRGEWKFKNYLEHHSTKTAFMNDKNNHTKGQCEILICMDHYFIRDNNGILLEENRKNVCWIGYKY